MDGRTDPTGAREPSDLRALAEEVARRRDVDAIRRLTATYNDAWDDGRCDDWVAVFTPDARFSMTDTPDIVGVDALREFAHAQRPGGSCTRRPTTSSTSTATPPSRPVG